MIDTSDPLVQIKITESVCAFVAICTTVYRLYVRRGRWWIDDAWAAFALVTLFAQIASVFMHVENPDDISKTSRVAAYYLMAITFYCVIWASRISIIYSVIRIDPNPSRRKIYVGISILYFITVVVLIIQLFWVCEPEPAWKDSKSPQCHLTTQVAVCQLITDILADLFLLFAPLRVFMHLQDKTLRKKLIVIFSTCLITTIVSLVHAAYILTTGGIRVIISALVEDCISLMVANVPVVVTALIRAAGDRDHDNRPPPSAGIVSTALQFATRKLRINKSSGSGEDEWTKDTTSSATLTNAPARSFGVFSHGGDATAPYGTTTTGEPIMLDLMPDKKGEAGKHTHTYPGEREEEVWNAKSGWTGTDSTKSRGADAV
ncbi:hypothetical protein V5O48_015409 [Marasmius crinis-equi]|uniref:Rhodopsin domain-containing protein n=1 Tax=Marasmius crinis-equi TaxID=585013 RepID=A0ABR3EUL0_9AGAR